MSIEKNVQIVKDFFAAIASGDNGSFRARIGRWPARTAGTRDRRVCLRKRPKR